jgi:hypothetical protein
VHLYKNRDLVLQIKQKGSYGKEPESVGVSRERDRGERGREREDGRERGGQRER